MKDTFVGILFGIMVGLSFSLTISHPSIPHILELLVSIIGCAVNLFYASKK